MSDPSTHNSRYIVETIDDQLPESEVVVSPDIDSYQPSKAWKPGELRSSLQKKITPSTPAYTSQSVSLPRFLQENNEKEKPAPFAAPPRAPHENELLTFSSLVKVLRDPFTNIQLISMSIPALVTVALLLSVASFFAGRFSASTSKQAVAEENPLPTVAPAAGIVSATTSPVQGTPDDIITAARNEFSVALTLSKKSDETATEKEEVSKSILHVLDVLTKGITAYPDVASLYFERAQVEKMVMESSPTLKAQAQVDYQKALELSPLSAAYYIGFADYYDVSGRDPQAIENYEKANRLEPKNLDALYPLAKLYAAAGRISEASALYAQVLTLLPTSSSQYAQVQQEAQALVPPTPVASQSATTQTATSSAIAH